jgi:hypothetical protein
MQRIAREAVRRRRGVLGVRAKLRDDLGWWQAGARAWDTAIVKA